MLNFKFFDINNSGSLDINEFRKAIERVGIMIPTQQDLEALFNLYDKDNNGCINYAEFGEAVYGRNNLTASSGGLEHAQQLLEKLRKMLFSRGARGIIGLGRNFRIMDDNHSMSLDKYEFEKGMSDFGLGFTSGEL